MSLNFQKLEPVCVRDPRTILDNQREYAILKSGSQTTFKQFTTTSIAISSLQFSCPPPSGNVIVDRKVWLYLPVRLSFTGVPPNTKTLINNQFDGPRSYPISSAIDTMDVRINGQSVSINMADVVQAMLHFNTDEKLKVHDYSMTPTCPDQSQNYNDLAGSNRNPLANYGASQDEDVMGRGGFTYFIVSNPVSNGSTPVTAVVDICFCEPLFLSPFYWGHSNSSGFYNVNTMDFTFNFLTNAANRFWSHIPSIVAANDNIITSASYTFGGLNGGPTSALPGGLAPLLHFQYITPQETQILSPNMSISYPYFDIQRYPTDLGSLAANTSFTGLQSNNIQLNSIPRRLYIFIRERDQDLFNAVGVTGGPEVGAVSHTDTFFQINNLNIQFQNKNGLLASASMQQLYQMSVKNHCNLSWTQWSGGPVLQPNIFSNTVTSVGTVGSVLCVEFATDIGLDALDAPGKNQQCMLQVQLNASNVSSRAINATMYIIAVLEGTFVIEGLGRASNKIGVISSQDVLDCQKKPFINYRDVEHVNGGNFLSGLKDFGRKLNSFLRDSKVISSTLGAIPHPYAQVPGMIARNLGYGEGYGEGVGVGGEGVLVGGKKLSRAALKQRIQEI